MSDYLVLSPLATFRWVNTKLWATGPGNEDPVVLNASHWLLVSAFSTPTTRDSALAQSKHRSNEESSRCINHLVRAGVLVAPESGQSEREERVAFADARCHSILQVQLGHARSLIEEEPRDRFGAPIPLYAYDAIDYLGRLDFRDCTIFEYGGGESTQWWAERADKVMVIESDSEWYERLRRTVAPNVEVILRTKPEAFESAILECETAPDVIIIDHGWDRAGACESVVKRLDSASLVILDNSEWHHEALQVLRGANQMIEVNLSGFGPGEHWIHGTTLFFSRAFAIPRLAPDEPVVPTGGRPRRTRSFHGET